MDRHATEADLAEYDETIKRYKEPITVELTKVVEITITQADRATILDSPWQMIARKRARIVAIKMRTAFVVETDRGDMEGAAGDWLVTNHPDDDPGSDIWSISDERMRNTYDPGPEPGDPDPAPLTVAGMVSMQDPTVLIRDAIATLYPASDRRQSLAITKLEEALLWLTAPTNL